MNRRWGRILDTPVIEVACPAAHTSTSTSDLWSYQNVPLRIMRRITFCAGHRLLGHDGKCKNLHGHNYVVEFHVVGERQDEIGRVIDFKLLKEKCKGWIDEHWDHAFVLWDQDENALEAVRHCEPHRIYELPYNPTAENMARYLLEVASPQILAGTGATADKIVVWESEESYAEVTRETVVGPSGREPAAEGDVALSAGSAR